MEQAAAEGVDVPLQWNQGGHRIVYTMCDEDLMTTVLNDLQIKIEKIVELDRKLYENHALKKGARKTIQKVAPRTLDRFLRPTTRDST